jgi:hypothetical protein
MKQTMNKLTDRRSSERLASAARPDDVNRLPGRALSVSPSQPIYVNEIHEVHSLYLLQALPERAIVERIRQFQTSLLRQSVLQRINYLNEGATKMKATYAEQTNLDERIIRKGGRIVHETLDYLSQQLNAEITENGHTTALAPPTIQYLEFYKQGLATILTVLETSEQFRFVLFAKDAFGWNLVLSLLSRYDATLRALCCQVIGQCLMNSTGRIDTLEGANHQEWNRERLEQLAVPACWSIIFHERYTDWGMSAIQETTSFFNRILVALDLTRRNVDLGTMRTSVIAAVRQCIVQGRVLRERAEAIFSQRHAMDAESRDIGETAHRINIEIQKLSDVSGVPNLATVLALKKASETLGLRVHANEVRLVEMQEALEQLL